MPQPIVLVVKQKQIPIGTELPGSNDNKSVPIGLVKTLEHYLGSAGILDCADTFKTDFDSFF